MEYHGTRVFVVGDHSVTIETRSVSLQRREDGPAEVIVSGAGFETVLPSRFNQASIYGCSPGTLLVARRR
ncbi:MAG: hypothetical protein ACPGLY_05965 [Rubripirellula sp.]